MKAKLVGALLGVVLFVVTVLAISPAQTPPPGEVWSIQTGTTLYYLRQALQGKVGTMIMSNGQGEYMFIWSMKEQGTGFTMLSENQKSVMDWVQATGGKANLANFTDGKQFVQWLRDNGWKAIPGSQVPHLVRLAIEAGGTALLSYSQNMVSFFVFPAGVEWEPIIPDGVEYES